MEREMNVCLVHSYAREQNEKIRDQAQLPTLFLVPADMMHEIQYCGVTFKNSAMLLQ